MKRAPWRGGERSLWTRRITRAIGVLIIAAVLVALVGVARRDGPAALAAWRSAQIRWAWIGLATGCGLAAQVVYALGWRRFLADCGVAVSLWQALRIFLASNLGRYLPGGKAWQMSIVGVMAQERGLPPAILAATSLLQGMVGVAVGALLLLGTGSATLGVSILWLALPAAGLASLLAGPMLLHHSGHLQEKILRRWPAVAAITSGTMWTLVWTSVACWLGWGGGLWALAHGLLGYTGSSVGAYLAAWIGPFIAGLIAFVSPAGLGARDAAMTVMLQAAGLSGGDAIVVAVLARVWGTLLEVVPAGAVLLIRRPRRAATLSADIDPA